MYFKKPVSKKHLLTNLKGKTSILFFLCAGTKRVLGVDCVNFSAVANCIRCACSACTTDTHFPTLRLKREPFKGRP